MLKLVLIVADFLNGNAGDFYNWDKNIIDHFVLVHIKIQQKIALFTILSYLKSMY